MARRPGRPGISDEEAEVVRGTLRKLMNEQHEGNASALARALGVSPSAISQAISGKNRPSYDMVTILAGHLKIEPRDVLAGKVAPTAQPAPETDDYPNRAEALTRLEGVLPPEVERRLRGVVLDPTAPPRTVAKWMQLALRWTEEFYEDASLQRRSRD